MKIEEAKLIEDGVYFIDWESGGRSVGAIGRDWQGRAWYAPANWVSGPSQDWGKVASVELIEPQWPTKHFVGQRDAIR